MRRTVAFILSTPYAGSHYLSLVAGSNSRAIHGGELKQLRRAKPKEFRNECTFDAGKILEGIDDRNFERVHEIIFSRIDPGIQVLVDNSKRVDWAERFLTKEEFDKKFIFLIRDPRALARRYGLNSGLQKVWRHRLRVFRAIPALRSRIFFINEPYVWSYYWLVQNQRISRFLASHRIEPLVVTYRDLALNPGSEMAHLMESLGLSYEPGQLDYWNFDHVGTQKKNYEWVKEKKETFIDLRWKSELAPEVQRNICSDPLISAYIGSMNLKFAEDGLTKN